MSPQMSTPHGAASGLEKEAFTGEVLSPVEGDLIISPEQFQNAGEHLRSYLRTGLYDIIHKNRQPWLDRHGKLLQRIVLNDHSAGHLDHVTFGALQIGRAFPKKFSSDQLEAVVVGGMVHDVALTHAARAWVTRELKEQYGQPESQQDIPLNRSLESLLQGLDYLEFDDYDAAQQQWDLLPPPAYPILGKKQLDPHTHHGMTVLHEWIEDGPLTSPLSHWTPTQRRIAELTVLHHSNGSEYDRERVEPEVKLVRTADKLHNTRDRSVHLLNERSLHHPMNIHQFVPAAIESMSVSINRKAKQLVVDYMVDPSFVEDHMKPHDSAFQYNQDRFLHDVHEAYGKSSFPYASEGVSSFFAKGTKTHDPDAHLLIRYIFKDGSVVNRPYEPSTK